MPSIKMMSITARDHVNFSIRPRPGARSNSLRHNIIHRIVRARADNLLETRP